MKIIKPKRLAKGQTVGLVAPTSPCNEDKQIHISAFAGLMFGHIDDYTTLPIGCQAELDVEAGTLTLLEEAVT